MYTCIPVCVHMPAGSRGQASGGATCGRVDRHILCLVGKTALGPASAGAELVKPSLIVQYYLDSTLVAFW